MHWDRKIVGGVSQSGALRIHLLNLLMQIFANYQTLNLDTNYEHKNGCVSFKSKPIVLNPMITSENIEVKIDKKKEVYNRF